MCPATLFQVLRSLKLVATACLARAIAHSLHGAADDDDDDDDDDNDEAAPPGPLLRAAFMFLWLTPIFIWPRNNKGMSGFRKRLGALKLTGSCLPPPPHYPYRHSEPAEHPPSLERRGQAPSP